MADYTASRPNAETYANRLHDVLGRYGGTPADYLVFNGGADGSDYLRIITGAVDQTTLEAIMDGFNALTVQITVSVISVGNSTTITCDELPTEFQFAIFSPDGTILEDTADGTLELIGQEAGEYIVEIKDPSGYANGYATIEVTS